MLIKELKFYIKAGEPATRQATNRDRGTMMKVPPGLSGLFTHAEGVRAQAVARLAKLAEYRVPITDDVLAKMDLKLPAALAEQVAADSY